MIEFSGVRFKTFFPKLALSEFLLNLIQYTDVNPFLELPKSVALTAYICRQFTCVWAILLQTQFNLETFASFRRTWDLTITTWDLGDGIL